MTSEETLEVKIQVNSALATILEVVRNLKAREGRKDTHTMALMSAVMSINKSMENLK